MELREGVALEHVARLAELFLVEARQVVRAAAGRALGQLDTWVVLTDLSACHCGKRLPM